MGDDDEFSFLTDSEDEKAVEDVLAQALDHSVLEQIAAINCSSFDHILPTNLETRFRKLKSLPTNTTTASASSRFTPAKSKSFTPQSVVDSPEKVLKSKTRNKSRSYSSSSSPSESESGTLSPKTGRKSKLKSVTSSFKSMRRSISSLWRSGKKEKIKIGKENRSFSLTSFGDFDDDEFLKSFSSKEQKRIMKQAMKEEEKINREADKIVKWAKQASSRMMNVSGLEHIEDELSD